VFNTDQIGVLLHGTMQGRIRVTDFQDWVSWRRLVVAPSYVPRWKAKVRASRSS
jgi:hypothetical protein